MNSFAPYSAAITRITNAARYINHLIGTAAIPRRNSRTSYVQREFEFHNAKSMVSEIRCKFCAIRALVPQEICPHPQFSCLFLEKIIYFSAILVHHTNQIISINLSL